jgi:hypothetical protein
MFTEVSYNCIFLVSFIIYPPSLTILFESSLIFSFKRTTLSVTGLFYWFSNLYFFSLLGLLGVQFYFFYLRSFFFVWYNVNTPALFCLGFAWYVILHYLAFSLFVSLRLQWVSCVQHIVACLKKNSIWPLHLFWIIYSIYT